MQLRQITVVNTANDRRHADLVWWTLMIVRANASSGKVHPPRLLSCLAVRLKRACTCRAAVPPCHGCPLRVQLRDQSAACDGWLSAPVFQVFGEHSTLSVSFGTQKNHRALSVPRHLSSLRKNSPRPLAFPTGNPATAPAPLERFTCGFTGKVQIKTVMVPNEC